MDRERLEKILTCFQASARGNLVRNEIRRAREDFEGVVREIDGSLTHLEWRETCIPIPRFTDTDGPLRPGSSARTFSKPELDVHSGCQTQLTASAASSSVERRDHPAVREKTEAERDDSQIKRHSSPSTDCLSNEDVREAVEGQKESTVEDEDGAVTVSTGESTTAWSSLELDMSCGLSFKGSRRYCLAQEVPCTPEALRLHRNTLTMELLWLQQAIDSRKKYLSLKDRLSVS